RLRAGFSAVRSRGRLVLRVARRRAVAPSPVPDRRWLARAACSRNARRSWMAERESRTVPGRAPGRGLSHRPAAIRIGTALVAALVLLGGVAPVALAQEGLELTTDYPAVAVA